jgi:hypothetical protein
MRIGKVGLFVLCAVALCTIVSQGPKKPLKANPPRHYTLRVYHEECTECGDFEIDSGKVVVPVHLREQLIQNSMKSGAMRGWKYERVAEVYKSRGYEVGSLRLETDAEFDALFLLPGRTKEDTIRNSAPWDFERKYRVTGVITGLKWQYVQFKVLKAVLIKKKRGAR